MAFFDISDFYLLEISKAEVDLSVGHLKVTLMCQGQSKNPVAYAHISFAYKLDGKWDVIDYLETPYGVFMDENLKEMITKQLVKIFSPVIDEHAFI